MSQLPPNTVVVRAMGKVNLFLRVVGRREDGYHDLESLIVPVDLADRLEIHAAADPAEFHALSLSLEVIGDESLVRGVPADESNLVLRAAAALAERTETRGFADITLEKRVPAAGGLGGGSADAAAALRALNDLWACGLDQDELLAVAAQVGSDIPALMVGGAVVARGRGERVGPFSMPGLNLALATFDFGVATADAFGWWDEDGEQSGPDPARILREADRRVRGDRLADLRPFSRLLHNDLEGPVVRRHPVVEEAKSLLLRAGALGVVMSGSGPSLVAVLPWETTELEGAAWREVERLTGRPVIRVGTEPVAQERELGPRDSNADFRDQNPASCQLDEGPPISGHDTREQLAATPSRGWGGRWWGHEGGWDNPAQWRHGDPLGASPRSCSPQARESA